MTPEREKELLDQGSPQKAWRATAKADGRCVTCGKKRERLVSHCDSCRAKANAARQMRRAKTAKGFRKGSTHPCWLGDAASDNGGRQRAQKAFQLGPCARCGKPGHDRHHKDGNTKNNSPDNVEVLCRRCHMVTDGRLEAFAANGQAAMQRKAASCPTLPCVNCGAPAPPRKRRKGRCTACSAFWYAHGSERPRRTA